jgi:hypothetical protein
MAAGAGADPKIPVCRSTSTARWRRRAAVLFRAREQLDPGIYRLNDVACWHLANDCRRVSQDSVALVASTTPAIVIAAAGWRPAAACYITSWRDYRSRATRFFRRVPIRGARGRQLLEGARHIKFRVSWCQWPRASSSSIDVGTPTPTGSCGGCRVRASAVDHVSGPRGRSRSSASRASGAERGGQFTSRRSGEGCSIG